MIRDYVTSVYVIVCVCAIYNSGKYSCYILPVGIRVHLVVRDFIYDEVELF